jgi:hypothetical protein
VLANEATIVKICIGFSRARQRFSWVMNGHFAHVSSGGEKRPKDRPRSVDGVNLEFFSRSRFRKSEKISITLPFGKKCLAPRPRENEQCSAVFCSGERGLKTREQVASASLHTSRWRRKPRKATWRTSRSTPRRSSRRSS